MEDLATEAVGLGRQVADRGQSATSGDNAKDVAFRITLLCRLREVLGEEGLVFSFSLLPK